MNDDIQDPNGATPADLNAGGDSSAISDPRFARLAELEDYAARAQATFERLKPYEEDIRALENDEDYREGTRAYLKSYNQIREEQRKAEADAIPESEKRMRAFISEEVGKFKPVIEDYDARAQTEVRTREEATKKFTQDNLEYAQRLVAEQKLTPEEVGDLGRFAKVLHDESVAKGEPRFVGLEEAYKRVHGRAQAAPAPKSLRAKAGATGVPGASRPVDTPRPDVSRPGGFTNYMLDKLNTQRKAG